MCAICRLVWIREQAQSSGNYSASETDPALSATFNSAPTEALFLSLPAADGQSADGVGGTVAANSVSGDLRIDGLLTLNRWTSSTLTYSDPDTPADYQVGYVVDRDGDGLSAQNDTFAQLSNAQRVALHFALNDTILTQPVGAAGFSLAGFTNITVNYAGAGSGTAALGMQTRLTMLSASHFFHHRRSMEGTAGSAVTSRLLSKETISGTIRCMK